MNRDGNTNKGYIKLERSITDNFLWKIKPFDKARAWVDLLLLATWRESKEFYKGAIVERKPGQITASKLWFAERWGWHRDKVTRFFMLLEQEQMATISTTTNGTTVTIVNWAKYQTDTQQTQQPIQQVTQQPPGNRHNNHLAHYKKVKESKESNNNLEELNAHAREATDVTTEDSIEDHAGEVVIINGQKYVRTSIVDPSLQDELPVLVPTAETVQNRLAEMRKQRDEVARKWGFKE